MELSKQELYNRLAKIKADPNTSKARMSKELEYRVKERDIIEDQANNTTTTKPTGKYIRDPMNSLTIEQIVAVNLGYPKNEDGYYQYPTKDEPERYYEFITALQTEKRKRTLQEVKRCLYDIRAGTLGLLEHKIINHISGLKVWMMVNHSVTSPRMLVQNLLLALCDLDPIPQSYQKTVLAILDSIPNTKPETPQETLDREARNAPPIPWRNEPGTLEIINKIQKLISIDNVMDHVPWPTEEEYMHDLQVQQKAQAAQIVQTKSGNPSSPSPSSHKSVKPIPQSQAAIEKEQWHYSLPEAERTTKALLDVLNTK